jgi:hypothetical protein
MLRAFPEIPFLVILHTRPIEIGGWFGEGDLVVLDY